MSAAYHFSQSVETDERIWNPDDFALFALVSWYSLSYDRALVALDRLDLYSSAHPLARCKYTVLDAGQLAIYLPSREPSDSSAIIATHVRWGQAAQECRSSLIGWVHAGLYLISVASVSVDAADDSIRHCDLTSRHRGDCDTGRDNIKHWSRHLFIKSLALEANRSCK